MVRERKECIELPTQRSLTHTSFVSYGHHYRHRPTKFSSQQSSCLLTEGPSNIISFIFTDACEHKRTYKHADMVVVNALCDSHFAGTNLFGVGVFAWSVQRRSHDDRLIHMMPKPCAVTSLPVRIIFIKCARRGIKYEHSGLRLVRFMCT